MGDRAQPWGRLAIYRLEPGAFETRVERFKTTVKTAFWLNRSTHSVPALSGRTTGDKLVQLKKAASVYTENDSSNEPNLMKPSLQASGQNPPD